MYKKELYDIVKEKVNDGIEKKSNAFSHQDVKDVIEAFLDTIIEQVTRGEDINLRDFGKFERVIVDGRTGISPLNNKPYVSKKHGAVKFRVASHFKEAVR